MTSSWGPPENSVERAEEGTEADAAEDEEKLGGCDDAVDFSLCWGIAVGEVVKLAYVIRDLGVGQAMKHCVCGRVNNDRRVIRGKNRRV